MARTRFKYNPNFEREMEANPKFKAAMLDRAERIVSEVQSKGGRFTKGYRAIKTSGGARAGTDSPFAHWDEWGNRFRSPRAPMRRALGALGLLGRTNIKGK